MRLPGGLARDRAAGLGDLIARITGRPRGTALPCLAPALLFSQPAVQSRLALPRADERQVLVQEYQSVEYPRALPLDRDLTAQAERSGDNGFADFRFTLSDSQGPVAILGTALRLFPISDLGAVKPTTFRPASLGESVTWGDPVAVSQDQTDAYLSLSGDGNPIHRDAAQAHRLGLPAPIVPGLLLVSLIQPYFEAALPPGTLMSLKSRFLAPLCVAAALRIGIQPRGTPTGDTQKARAYLIDGADRALAIVDLQLRVTPT